MTTLRLLLPVLACLLMAACATTQPATGTGSPGADPAAVVESPAAELQTSVDTQDEAYSSDSTPMPDADQASDAEADFAAIYGSADASASGHQAGAASTSTAYDPWEKYNRRVHGFNSTVDRHLAKPLAQAYSEVVPRPIRIGVGNFFDNLGEPVTLVNSVLQGNPRGAANSLGRFLLNSTVGIGGLFDVASKVKMPERGEDFGQTLAVWGWQRSRYLEVPFLGPRTLRDLIGLAADTPLRPLGYLEDDKARLFLQGTQAVDLRARLLAIESMGEDAVDEYALFRDIWSQRRNYQIQQRGRQGNEADAPQTDTTLPPYLMEEGGEDSPGEAAYPLVTEAPGPGRSSD